MTLRLKSCRAPRERCMNGSLSDRAFAAFIGMRATGAPIMLAARPPALHAWNDDRAAGSVFFDVPRSALTDRRWPEAAINAQAQRHTAGVATLGREVGGVRLRRMHGRPIRRRGRFGPDRPACKRHAQHQARHHRQSAAHHSQSLNTRARHACAVARSPIRTTASTAGMQARTLSGPCTPMAQGPKPILRY